jgi:hypothetical protein
MIAIQSLAGILLGLVLGGTKLGSADLFPLLDKELFQRTARSDQLVFVYLYLEGSQPCKQMLQQTLNQDLCRKELSGLTCARADIAGPEGGALLERYQVNVVPTALLMTGKGELEDAIIGFLPPPEFLAQLRRIKRGNDTLSVLRDRVARDPKDLNARLALANKLQYLGDQQGFQELLDSIRKADPHGKTEVGAQLIMQDLQQAATTQATSGEVPTTPDLGPIYTFAKRARHDRVRFQAWVWLSRQERTAGRNGASRTAAIEAYKQAPDSNRASWGNEMVREFLGDREALSRGERKLALKVAEGNQQAAETSWKNSGSPKPIANDALIEQLGGAYATLAIAQALNGKKKAVQRVFDTARELLPESRELEELAQQLAALN